MADSLAVQHGVMFGEIVAHVLESRVPFDIKLCVSNLVSNPKIVHFHGAGTLVLAGVVGNSGSSGVLTMDGSWWLWVAKFL